MLDQYSTDFGELFNIPFVNKNIFHKTRFPIPTIPIIPRREVSRDQITYT